MTKRQDRIFRGPVLIYKEKLVTLQVILSHIFFRQLMKKYRIILIAVILAATVSAKTVDNQAGELSRILEGQNDIEELTVSGSVNAADFEFILNSLPSLTSLDISSARISAYEGEPLKNTGRTFSAADEIPEYALFGSPVRTLRLPVGITAIGESAFAGSGITEITIPPSVRTIGDRAFAGSSIERIIIPSTVTEIGKGIFRNSIKLADVVIKTSAGVSQEAFFGCTSLVKVTLADDTESIGVRAFSGTKALQDMIFPPSLETIGDYAFSGSGIISVNLADNENITVIGNGAFENCLNLRKVVLPQSLTAISESLFFGDKSLTDLTVPLNIKSIDRLALAGDGKLSETPLYSDLQQVSTIGDYAMVGVSSVTGLTLPRTLVYIGKGAMENMTGLVDISAETLSIKPELGEDVWKNIGQRNVTLTVDEKVAPEFEKDSQWRLFNIVRKSSRSETVTDEMTEFSPVLRLESSVLTIETDKNMSLIAVYGLSGSVVAMIYPNDSFARIDLGELSSALYIIEVRSIDNENKIFKLIKK